jgi:hypothetical protein
LVADFTSKRRGELADHLGLPATVLDRLDIGYLAKEDGWTFPECDHRGKVIGLLVRKRDGSKRMMRGGQRGLTISAGWEEILGDVYLVEGASDTLALTEMGLSAVGRPSCTGGVDYLARMLSALSEDQEIVVIGENDKKADGTWPGKAGAIKTAEQLARRLNRPVHWTLPPDDAKDIREWVRARKLSPHKDSVWKVAGKELARLLAGAAQTLPSLQIARLRL